jgi:DNA-binding NarL/FixJ family response regulator
MELTDELIASYDLDFARPYAVWNNAFIALGLRQFGLADRLLQTLEDSSLAKPVGFHVLNARLLRARLCLHTGQSGHALDAVFPEPRELAIPSIHGEYLATRALALAVAGESSAANRDAKRAERTSTAIEVRVLAQTARAVLGTHAGDTNQVTKAWRLAEKLGAWDALVTGLRSEPAFAQALAQQPDIRPRLAELYARTNDLGLARKAGLRVRAAGQPQQLLSPRELEVLELLASGFRNREIAEALVVSQSTIKAHIRHILEKLGVRTRTGVDMGENPFSNLRVTLHLTPFIEGQSSRLLEKPRGKANLANVVDQSAEVG